jgi:hypothetical protein
MKELNDILWHVMDGMADDWESITQIKPHALQYCKITEDEISKALIVLYEANLIEAMDENGYSISSLPSNIRETWFRMTTQGRLLWDSEGIKYRD